MKRLLVQTSWLALLLLGNPAWAWPQTALEQLEETVRGQVEPLPPAAGGGYLGIHTPEPAEPGGVRVNAVLAGSPAEAAGMQVGDVIVAVDGVEIRSNDDLGRMVYGRSPGARLPMRVRRGEQFVQIDVVLGTAPSNRVPPLADPPAGIAAPALVQPDPQSPRLGITMAAVTPEAQFALGLPAARGAWVVEVRSGSPAQSAGIPEGAVIVFADGRRIDSPEDLRRLVLEAAAGKQMKVSFYSQGQLMERLVTLDNANSVTAPAVDPIPVVAQRADPKGDDPVAQLELRIQALEQRLAEIERLLSGKDQP
jgi:S1-C subfamily serine protease